MYFVIRDEKLRKIEREEQENFMWFYFKNIFYMVEYKFVFEFENYQGREEIYDSQCLEVKNK